MRKTKRVPTLLKKEFQLELIHLGKSKLEEFATAIAEKVESGEINPLLAESWLYRIEYIAKQAREKIAQTLHDELDRYPEKIPAAYGLAFTRKATSTRYDYSATPDYKRLKDDVALIEQYAQKAEKSKTPVQLYDEDGTFRFTIHPASKIQKFGYSREIVD